MSPTDAVVTEFSPFLFLHFPHSPNKNESAHNAQQKPRISLFLFLFFCLQRGTVLTLTMTSAPLKSNNNALTTESRVLLHGLYRRLRENGEDAKMIRRALSTNPLEANVATAKRFLAYHRGLVEVAEGRSTLRFYQLPRRIRLSIRYKVCAFHLFRLRLALLSIAAISDFLVLSLCVAVLFFLYQMYRLCRIGLSRAEEKYKTLAIPIIQTIEALELTEQHRQEKRKAMEQDIINSRR